jgi:hypothetical protein
MRGQDRRYMGMTECIERLVFGVERVFTFDNKFERWTKASSENGMYILLAARGVYKTTQLDCFVLYFALTRKRADLRL